MLNLLGRTKINAAPPQGEQKEKVGALITKEPITKEEREILEAEKVYRAGTVSVRDLIAPSAMRVQPQFLALGSLFVRTVFATLYPRYISIGWVMPIINFNALLDVAM